MNYKKASSWIFWASVRNILRGTKGQALAIAALALPVIAGGAALAVDVGHAYVAKTAIQTAVDAGARAGAAILADGGSEADATTAATTYANANLDAVSYLANATPTVTFPSSTSISVSVEHDVPFYFAPVVGVDSTSVSASATASLFSVSAVGANSLIPLAIYCNTPTGCAGVLSVGQTYALRRYCGDFFVDGPNENSCGADIADGEVFLIAITYDAYTGRLRTVFEEGYPKEVELAQLVRPVDNLSYWRRGTDDHWRRGMRNRLARGKNETIIPIISPRSQSLMSSYNMQIADFVKVDISSFVQQGFSDTTTLQITQGAVSTTDFADSDEGLGINSVVGVRLSN